MPWTTTIDPEQRLLLTRVTAPIGNAREIRAHYEDVAADPQFDSTFSELLDMTAVQHPEISTDDIRQLATKSRFTPAARRAFVAHAPAVFGLARMFAAYREAAGARDDTLMVFNSEEDALRWLKAGIR